MIIRIDYSYLDHTNRERCGTWRGEKSDAIRAAADFLGAHKAADGYTYHAPETGAWYLISEEDLAELGAAVLCGHGERAYSLWCAAHPGMECDAPE
jgi:hypothetical protein